MNMDAVPVMQIYAYSSQSTSELAQYLEDNIIPRFERISGVASRIDDGQHRSADCGGF